MSCRWACEACPDVKQMSTEFVQDVCPEAASGQVKRACQRLGLIAATREKAIDFGVLLWPEKTPRVRPSLVFAWIKERGGCGYGD